MWSHTLRELVLPVNYRVTAVRGSTSYPLPCPLASSQQSNRPSYSGARLPLSRPRHPPWRRNLGRRGWTDRAAISCASGAGPRRLSVLLFLLPFRSEALGSASFSSASSSDYSSDGVLGSCSGFNGKILSGESQDNTSPGQEKFNLKTKEEKRLILKPDQ
ncbi:hypothetical protein MUK42_19442 [Musa troglodytarum]|uniref:Uncharacterized protein n=1 Tax=Musa troglodytarum TaxID=320322 RepID=A0A9E7K721_9LILI|nr:hypothetical protein MUK42_19442 [Musa troglodytarum]